jgi:SAM-dependent methyltransferase
MTDASETRDQVARAYEKALRRSRQGEGSCCSTSGCSGEATPAGAAAGVAGYDSELQAHPEAASSSFGCGNPLAFAGVTEGQTVVDLGSGAGLDLLIAAEKVGPSGRVIGVDMTDAMIDAARENAARAGLENVEVRKGLIEELPVESGTADWVISNCVVNLSPEKERVFAEIHRVLAPGGRMSISDIVVEDLPQVIRDHAAAYTACVAGAVSESEYEGGLLAAGLVDVEVDERQVYDLDQIRAIVGSDLSAAGLAAGDLDRLLPLVEGKVASVRFRGRKPRQ